MNRQSRRHPTHPLLPIQYPERAGSSDLKGTKVKGKLKNGGSATQHNKAVSSMKLPSKPSSK